MIIKEQASRPSVIRMNPISRETEMKVQRGNPTETIQTPINLTTKSSSLDNLTSSDFLHRSDTGIRTGKRFNLTGARRRKSSMPTKIKQNSEK